MRENFDEVAYAERTRKLEMRRRRERIRRRRKVRRQRLFIKRAIICSVCALVIAVVVHIFAAHGKDASGAGISDPDENEWLVSSSELSGELIFPEKVNTNTQGKAVMLMTAADRKAENEERIRQEKERQEKERVENLENGGYLWASPKGAVDGKDFYYMDQPENDPALLEDRGKIIYLTFDDGPSDYTSELLDFLDKYPEVKVTFFVVGQCRNHYDQIGRAAKAGHSIAVHSFTHDFKKIYRNTESFWEDFEMMQDVIEEQTGYRSQLMRFPGGSSNSSSEGVSQGIMTQLTAEANEKGYTYVDWNNASNDAGMTTDPNQEIVYIKQLLSESHPNIILNHDSKEYTVKAMKTFIPWALEQGYTFLPMSPRSATAHHTVVN